MCDDTKNLNKSESETFFRYHIFPIPNPILFLKPNNCRYRIRYFSSIPNFSDTESNTFRYQILQSIKDFLIIFFNTKSETFFSIPNISDTESDTFFDTNFFLIPNPILILIPYFFQSRIQYHYKKNGKVLKQIPIPIPNFTKTRFV